MEYNLSEESENFDLSIKQAYGKYLQKDPKEVKRVPLEEILGRLIVISNTKTQDSTSKETEMYDQILNYFIEYPLMISANEFLVQNIVERLIDLSENDKKSSQILENFLTKSRYEYI